MSTTRVEVPAGRGWFDLRPLDVLTSDHQFDFDDFREGLREQKRTARTEPAPSDNPAVMPDPAEEVIRLTARETVPIHQLVMGWVVADSSYGVPVPWPLPGIAWNTLRLALAPYYEVLNGGIPKEETETGGSTSATTSTDPVPAPQQEPAPA